MPRCYVVGCLVQMALLLFFGLVFFLFCSFAPLALSATVGARHQIKSINSTQLVRWRPASVRVALLCCSVGGAVSGFHHRTGSKSRVCVCVLFMALPPLKSLFVVALARRPMVSADSSAASSSISTVGSRTCLGLNFLSFFFF